MKSFPVLLGFVLLSSSSTSELYSSVVDLIPLVETEDVIVKALKKYVTEMDEKLIKLKQHLDNLQNEREKVDKNVEEYVYNPINAFLLVKRLTLGWKEVEKAMMENPGPELIRNITSMEDLKFPDDEDLSGAADAIVRIQETYNLNATDISKGILNGIQFDSLMTANDCFEIGKQSYEIEDHHQTVLWMTEAERIYSQEIDKTVEKSKILEYLTYSLYKEKDVARASNLTNELLDIDPDSEIGRNNILIFQEAIRNPENETIQEILTEPTVTYRYERGIYDRLCSNEVTVDESIKSELKCRYVDYERPFLKLAKLKEEEIYPRPKLLLYHDVLYDKEIEAIKEVVGPNMKRAEVYQDWGGTSKSKTRVSKVGWLRDDDHFYTPILNQRVEDMTGLTATTAEAYQVLNYGMGGYYATHYDWVNVSTEKGQMSYHFTHFGDRTATLLFYMTDVKQGGATVFPNLKVAVWPKKGTALLWPNLYFDGTGSPSVLHAACPVISGNKWVINKWFHERGQEFLRPCALSRDEI